jgi:hypothetical protein
MRKIEEITKDLITELERATVLKDLTPDHDIYNAFRHMVLNQNDIFQTLSSTVDVDQYSNLIQYIISKFIWHLKPNTSDITETKAKIWDQMLDYINDNQLMMLGVGAINNSTNINACIIFQLYHTRQGFHLSFKGGYIDRELISEMCRSAVKNYSRFIKEVSEHITVTLGRQIVPI